LKAVLRHKGVERPVSTQNVSSNERAASCGLATFTVTWNIPTRELYIHTVADTGPAGTCVLRCAGVRDSSRACAWP
jgi:hypothetical protein